MRNRVEAFDFPLAAEVADDCGEFAGVVAVFQQPAQGGHGLRGEDGRGCGYGPALCPVALRGFGDLPEAAVVVEKGGQAGGVVWAGVRHCYSPWAGGLAGGGLCARAASSVCCMRVMSPAVSGAAIMVPGGAWKRGNPQYMRVWVPHRTAQPGWARPAWAAALGCCSS